MATTPEGEKGEGLKNFFLNLFSKAHTAQDDEASDEVIDEAPLKEEVSSLDKFALSEKEEAENYVKMKDHALYELYCIKKEIPLSDDDRADFHLSVFIEYGHSAGREQRAFLRKIGQEARGALQKAKMEEPEPIDAQAFVEVSANKMCAWVFLLPEINDGKPLLLEDIKKLLEAKSIAFGIDEEKLVYICEKQKGFILCEIAAGAAAIDGEDGSIEDRYKRQVEIELTVKEDNTIDYKDLGWLQTIEKGEVVCDIIPPTPATPGKDVYFKDVRGKDGRKAVVPKGQGTRVDENDDTKLVANIDGVVMFQSSRFRVDPLLIIKGDVDTAVGDLDVVGNVLVNGDIQEGFTVIASGDITVQGMVEGAQVVAGGDIQVGRGMNGNSHGMLQAKKQVRCKFLENANVTAGGKIICDTIVNSTISSDEAIVVKTGRGAIIGGCITSLKYIEANTIGNQANRSIVINMGSTANFLKEKNELEEKHAKSAKTVSGFEKDIKYLGMSNNRSKKAIEIRDDLKLKLTVEKIHLANLDKDLQEMQKKQSDNEACRIKAEVIFPPAQITIGNFTKILRETAFNPLIYLKEGEIHIANV